jgi:nitrate/nitrite-specific signal transduction histidine kinase
MAEERQDERMQIAAYLHDDLAQIALRLNLQVEMAKTGSRLGIWRVSSRTSTASQRPRTLSGP